MSSRRTPVVYATVASSAGSAGASKRMNSEDASSTLTPSIAPISLATRSRSATRCSTQSNVRRSGPAATASSSWGVSVSSSR